MKRYRLSSCGKKRFRHRGVGLLIVLATLIMTITASVSLLRLASTAQLRQQVQDRIGLANSLLEGAESAGGPIQHWLAHDSAKVALGIDVSVPGMGVLHDGWKDQQTGDPVELHITAFDQLGMVPWKLVEGGSPWRLTLPPTVLNVLDQQLMNTDPHSPVFGLDEFQLLTQQGQQEVCVYPASIRGVDALSGDSVLVPETPEGLISDSDQQPLAVGGFLATHPACEPDAPLMINVNTAPMPLIEAAMRAAGRDGMGVIRAARVLGNPAPAPPSAADKNTGTNSTLGSLPQFVSSSTCWAFRIDCRVGPLRRSWWTVYEPANTRASADSKPWECVQRLVIPE